MEFLEVRLHAQFLFLDRYGNNSIFINKSNWVPTMTIAIAPKNEN